MFNKSALASLSLVAICLCPLEAQAICAAQWFEGAWYCKSPGQYELLIGHDGGGECSLSAVMQSPYGAPVRMDLVAADAASFTVRDEGGATVHLRQYSDGSFARGAFTIEGIADPIYCGRTPNLYVPLRGVSVFRRVRDMTHFLSLRAYP